jgi:hypothetical protein
LEAETDTVMGSASIQVIRVVFGFDSGCLKIRLKDGDLGGARRQAGPGEEQSGKMPSNGR